jgi:hypothetical protein
MSEDDYSGSTRVAEQAAARLQGVDITVTTEGERGSALDYLRTHPEHATLIASELDKLIDSYNTLQITPENEGLLQCSAELKKVLPHLPLIGEIMSGVDNSAHSMDWRRAYLAAIRTSAERIERGSEQGRGMDEEALMNLDKDPDVYVHHLFDTHPKAMLLAVAYHLYEDTVDRSPTYAGRVPGKDTVTNALIELLIAEHADSPLYDLTGNPASDQEDGGLDWIAEFEGFSPELLAKAAQISEVKNSTE